MYNLKTWSLDIFISKKLCHNSDIIPNIYADSNHLDMFIISHDTDVCKHVCSCIHPCIGGSVGGQNCLPLISIVWLWHCTQFCDYMSQVMLWNTLCKATVT